MQTRQMSWEVKKSNHEMHLIETNNTGVGSYETDDDDDNKDENNEVNCKTITRT